MRAPLRNRTVDLLLTIPDQAVRQIAAQPLNSPNTDCQQLWPALASRR
jgi:hypothetical protein